MHLHHFGQSLPRCCLSPPSPPHPKIWKEETGASSPEAGYFWCRGMPIPLSAGDDNEIRFAGQHVLRPEQFSHLDTKMFMVIMLCGVHKCPQHVRVRGGQKQKKRVMGVQAKHNSAPSSSPAAFQHQFAVDGKPQTKTQGPRVNQDNFPPDKQLGKAFWKTKPQGC